MNVLWKMLQIMAQYIRETASKYELWCFSISRLHQFNYLLPNGTKHLCVAVSISQFYPLNCPSNVLILMNINNFGASFFLFINYRIYSNLMHLFKLKKANDEREREK